MSPISLHQSKKFLAYYNYNNEPQLIFNWKTGIREEILEKGFKQLDIMMTDYSKVSVILLQLHQDHFTEDNAILTRCLVQLKKKIKKKYNCKIGYLWVREQNNADGQHYHLAIMVNGHKCNNAYAIGKMCEEVWEGPTDTNFAYRVRNRIYRIERYKNDDHELRAARMRMSYMAKNDSKHFEKYTNCFGVSRLKPSNRR